MFPMWIIVAAVAAIVVVAATVVLFRRPTGSDLSSVKRYHSALGTMEHLSDRPGQTVGKVTAPPGGPGVPVETGRSVPPVPVRGTDEFPDPEAPLVFDDSRPHDRYQPNERFDPDRQPRFAPSRNRAERNALQSMNRRPRRSAAVIAAVIVVALVGVLILIGSHKPKPSAAQRSGGTGSGSHHQTTGGDHGTTGGKKGHHTQVTSPPPPTTQVVALTSTPLTATYPASGSSYQVTVISTGPCWVQATSNTTGSVIWTGTMQAGQTQQIPATGVIAVELGSATCSMKLNSVPVVFPTPMGTPFTATFQPGAASSAGTTATTAPSTSTSTSTTSTTVPSTTGSTAPSTSVP
jgi:hypothetical protein